MAFAQCWFAEHGPEGAAFEYPVAIKRVLEILEGLNRFVLFLPEVSDLARQFRAPCRFHSHPFLPCTAEFGCKSGSKGRSIITITIILVFLAGSPLHSRRSK
jgi:hypothetical protein